MGRLLDLRPLVLGLGVLADVRSFLGHFQVGSYRYRRSIYLIEALYTLNSAPVVSFMLWGYLGAVV